MPNASAGSITIASAPASGAIHGGPTQNGPTATGRWNARHASRQPGATGLGHAPAIDGVSPAGR